MNLPLAMIATGARTPLGLDSANAAAAVRAALSSCGEHPFMIDQAGDPMPASMDAILEPGLPCRERMLVMAQAALQEACGPLAQREGVQRIPLLLGLPEPRPGFGETDGHWLHDQLLRKTDLPVPVSDIRAYMSGHGATLFLLDQARQEVAEGRYDGCLVGGVDSYFHPDTMDWLDRNRQLVGTVSRSGFVPGEGAGFVLLMTPATAQRAGLHPLGMITGTAAEWENKLIKTQDINLGEGLIRAVNGAVSAVLPPHDTIHSIYCDINGERYRGEEWGFVCLKLAHYFADPTGYCSPADCWGDMGAASGGLLLALATQAAQRGYAAGSRSLMWTGSEHGLRAAAVLDAPVIPSPYRG
ncbi:MAG: beta-ketoacyl synthase N-terminal-like domain-containing protein [Pseudomonadota bacterium]